MRKSRLEKVLFALLIIIMIFTISPAVQYATTDESDSSFKHNISKLLTTLRVVTPHQDTFTAWMESDLGIDESVANYRTYYKAGETLKVRVTFTTEIVKVENPQLVLKFGDSVERVVGAPTVENDYVLFEYKIQEGDNGGLTFESLLGTVYDENGNSIEMRSPSDLNMYRNDIVADTTVSDPVTEYDVEANEITFAENIYVIDDEYNEIRRLNKEDIYFLRYEDNTVTAGNSDTISMPNGGNKITILTDEFDVVCINAVDIAGNPMSIHYYIKDILDEEGNVVIPEGSTTVNPILQVSVDETSAKENTVDEVTYLKSEKEITIKTWNFHKTENTKVQVSFDGKNYKDATYTGERDGNLYVWKYVIQEGDNGALNIKLSGDCHCGNDFATNNTVFENIVSDTKAPEVASMKIGISSGAGWYAAKDKTNISGTKMTSSSQLVEEGTLWVNRNSRPKVEYEFSDANLNPETKNNVVTAYVGTSTSSAYTGRITSGTAVTLSNPRAEGQLTYELKVYDAAGNETTYTQPDKLKIIVDHTGPKVTVNASTENSNQDTVEFTINVSDPNVAENLTGSGVRGTVDPYDVIVTNGTIIKSRTSGNNLIITVMPSGNGYISVYVPAKVIGDNLENLNSESNIKKIQIDRAAPVIADIQGNPTDWVKEATLSVTGYDNDSGLAEQPYSFDGGVTWQATNSKKITQNGPVVIALKDKVGNITTSTVQVTKIDTTAPSISGVEQNQVSEYATEVTINAKDEESGLAEYSFDGGETWQTSLTKTYTEADIIGEVQVKDKVGNISKYAANLVVEIKGKAPIIKLENNGGKFVVPTGADVAKVYTTVEVDAENDCEISYAISYSNNPSNAPSNYEKVTSNKVELSLELSEGTWYLWTRATDTKTNANSDVCISNAFEVKESAIEFRPSTTEKTSEDVTVEIVYGDGLTENRLAGIGDDREEGLSSVTLSENGTVYAEATDTAGNKVYATFEVTNIEKQPETAVTFDTTSEGTPIAEVKTIDGINYVLVAPGTTVENVLKYTKSAYFTEVRTSDRKETLDKTATVTTENVIYVDNVPEQYIIVVKGDVNNDGNVNWADVLKLNKARLQLDGIKETDVVLTQAESLAADVTSDDKITPSDMIKINKFRLEKIDTL